MKVLDKPEASQIVPAPAAEASPPAADADITDLMEMPVTTASGAGGDGAPLPSELLFLTNAMPASYRTVRACSMGSFFIIGQNVTELFAVSDMHSSEAEATKLSWQALTMRVATALRGAAGVLRSFDLVKAKLVEPKPLLRALIHNVYADTCPYALEP